MAETAWYQLLLQDSDSADEIECSSEEDAASPACMQAATASIAKMSQQQHDRVCTKTTYLFAMPSNLAAYSQHCQCLQARFALKLMCFAARATRSATQNCKAAYSHCFHAASSLRWDTVREFLANQTVVHHIVFTNCLCLLASVGRLYMQCARSCTSWDAAICK